MDNLHLKDIARVSLPKDTGYIGGDLGRGRVVSLTPEGDIWVSETAGGEPVRKARVEGLNGEKVIGIFFQPLLDRVLVATGTRLIWVGPGSAQSERPVEGVLAAGICPRGEWLVVLTRRGIESEETAGGHRRSMALDFEVLEGEIRFREDSNCVGISLRSATGVRLICLSPTLESLSSPVGYSPEFEEVTNVFEAFDQKLGTPLAFVSRSFTIASARTNSAGIELVLSEKNGLVYEKYLLPQALVAGRGVRAISADPRGASLALLLDGEKEWSILLVCRRNARWAVKKALPVPPETTILGFDSEGRMLIESSGLIASEPAEVPRGVWSLRFEAARDCFEHSKGSALAVFYEYPKLLATPLDSFLVPHPSSLCSAEVSGSAVEALSFSDDRLVSLDSQGRVNTFAFEFPRTLKSLGSLELGDCGRVSFFSLLGLRGLFVEHREDSHWLNLLEFSENFDRFERKRLSLDLRVRWAGNFEGDFALIDNANELYSLSSGEPQLVRSLDFLDGAVKSFKSFRKPGEAGWSWVVLTQNDKLYLDENIVGVDVSSFLVLPQHLCFTVATQSPYDLLAVYPLTAKTNLKLPLSSPSSAQNWLTRNIEKGAVLVASAKSRLVFELPRGNFESVHPRILAVGEAAELLDQGKLKEVLLFLRKQKLPLSLILDLNPQQTLAKISELVAALPADLLDLLIMDMNDSFTPELEQVLGPELFAQRKLESLSLTKTEGKIAFVSRGIIEAIKNDPKMTKTIILTYFKSDHLKSALKLIKSLQNDPSIRQESRAPHKGAAAPEARSSFDENLNYLCWLANADNLYNVAMLTFDLDMSAKVAKFTQKDPRDFLPYHESLRQLPEVERKLKIALDFKKPEKAIKILSQSGPSYLEKAVEIAREHNIFPEALRRYKDQPDQLEAIRRAYGEHLFSEKKFKQAIPFLVESGDVEKVLRACESVLDWEPGFRLLQAKNLKEQIPPFLERMKGLMLKIRAYKEVVEILKASNAGPAELVPALLRVNQFGEAKNLLAFVPPAERRAFEPEVEAAWKIEKSEIDNRAVKLRRNAERLKAVQLRKEQDKDFAYVDLDASKSVLDTTNSAFLDGVSVKTGMSEFRHMRVKPKNLAQRQIKENSVFEEEWLVANINAETMTEEEESKLVHLIYLLEFMNLQHLSKKLKDSIRDFIPLIEKKRIAKTLQQAAFEKENPIIFEMYNHIRELDLPNINPSQVLPLEKIRKVL